MASATRPPPYGNAAWQQPAATAKASIYLSYEALALSPKAHGPKGQYLAPKGIILSPAAHAPRLKYKQLLPLLLESLHLQSHAMTVQACPSLLVTTLYLPCQDCFASPCFAMPPRSQAVWQPSCLAAWRHGAWQLSRI